MTARRYLPDELFLKYQEIRATVSDGDFYNNPRYQKTMEIWCAARFGLAYGARLAPCALWVHERDAQTDTDFRFEVQGLQYPFQITEVQKPGRRRGSEYRFGSLATRTTVADWDEGTQHGPSWLRSAIEKKTQHYGGAVSLLNLLVYLNYVAIEQQYLELLNATADVASKYASVWLLNGNAVACISSNFCGPPNGP